MKKIIVIVLIAVMLFAVVGCTSKDDDIITITHKNYTEQRITGQLMSVYLESKGFKTEVKELAGTMLCYQALLNDDVDMYAEFTGTGYGVMFEQTETLTPQDTYDYVKKAFEERDGVTWLEPLGWNNTYVLSVTKDTAEKYGIETISDLVDVSGELVIGSDSEFMNRMDGLLGLIEAYPGLEFAEQKSMDQGLTYAALDSGDIDVNSSYSTDGRIAKFGFINLVDDKNFFPPYFVTPILKMDYAEENPEVVQALIELGGHWNDEEVQQYNFMVDDEKKDLREVATLMLQDKGLID